MAEDSALIEKENMPMDRRSFLLASAAPMLNAQRPPQYGAQLYTLRNQIEKDPETTIRRLAEIGYRQVEIIRRQLEVLPILRKHSLVPVSCHVEAAMVTGKWAEGAAFAKRFGAAYPEKPLDPARVLGELKAAGIRYAVIAYLVPEERGNYEELADRMNRFGSQCRDLGIQLAYHHHAFEFASANGGKRPIDTLISRFDPKLVQFEADIFWASVAGQNPAEFLKSLKGKLALVHLKDKAQNTAHQFHEMLPPEAFRELGSGSIDIRAAIAAASAAGAKHFFVEQDECPADPIDSLKKSWAYLSRLRT